MKYHEHINLGPTIVCIDGFDGQSVAISRDPRSFSPCLGLLREIRTVCAWLNENILHSLLPTFMITLSDEELSTALYEDRAVIFPDGSVFGLIFVNPREFAALSEFAAANALLRGLITMVTIDQWRTEKYDNPKFDESPLALRSRLRKAFGLWPDELAKSHRFGEIFPDEATDDMVQFYDGFMKATADGLPLINWRNGEFYRGLAVEFSEFFSEPDASNFIHLRHAKYLLGEQITCSQSNI